MSGPRLVSEDKESLEDIRTRLEAVAAGFCLTRGGSWWWDTAQMRITICRGGEVVATLKLEKTQ